MSPLQRERKPRNDKDLQPAASALSAPFQRAAQKGRKHPRMPPELTRVADAWPHLPEAVKAEILAMVTASRGEGIPAGS